MNHDVVEVIAQGVLYVMVLIAVAIIVIRKPKE